MPDRHPHPRRIIKCRPTAHRGLQRVHDQRCTANGNLQPDTGMLNTTSMQTCVCPRKAQQYFRITGYYRNPGRSPAKDHSGTNLGLTQAPAVNVQPYQPPRRRTCPSQTCSAIDPNQ